MENYRFLLKESTKKLIALSTQPEFREELLPKAPPVLWFGNNLTKKEKIVTIGANPSREEFLSENKFKTQDSLVSGGSLKYLQEPFCRFKTLDETQHWANILHDHALQDEIIFSYNIFRCSGYWSGLPF